MSSSGKSCETSPDVQVSGPGQSPRSTPAWNRPSPDVTGAARPPWIDELAWPESTARVPATTAMPCGQRCQTQSLHGA